MKRKSLILTSILLPLLASCEISYSHPITQEEAKGIISNTLNDVKKKDYSSFSRIQLHSTLIEERVLSVLVHSRFLESSYDFVYTASPYSLTIHTNYQNKEGKKTNLVSSKLIITRTDKTYMVSLNDDKLEDIKQDKFKAYWQFCDFPSYIKTISYGLLNKASTLIHSVGNENDKKENHLVGFQTSSKASDDLRIGFSGSNFDAGSLFFQQNYHSETASELEMYMTGNLIQEYSTTYSFVQNKEDDYYLAGSYEGKIKSRIKYE